MIEDDYYLAHDTQRALETAGATVLGPCAGPAECARLLELGSIDCAVVDINLGSGPTFEIPSCLMDRGIPFAFITGYDATIIPAEFGDIPRLEKPMLWPRLVKTVERLCGEESRSN